MEYSCQRIREYQHGCSADLPTLMNSGFPGLNDGIELIFSRRNFAPARGDHSEDNASAP